MKNLVLPWTRTFDDNQVDQLVAAVVSSVTVQKRSSWHYCMFEAQNATMEDAFKANVLECSWPLFALLKLSDPVGSFYSRQNAVDLDDSVGERADILKAYMALALRDDEFLQLVNMFWPKRVIAKRAPVPDGFYDKVADEMRSLRTEDLQLVGDFTHPGRKALLDQVIWAVSASENRHSEAGFDSAISLVEAYWTNSKERDLIKTLTDDALVDETMRAILGSQDTVLDGAAHFVGQPSRAADQRSG